MTAYTFTFPDGTFDRTAVALDPLGNPVATERIALVNSECRATFDLPTGDYRAKVEGVFADDSWVAPDAAPDGGGEYTRYEFECNDGVDIASGSAATVPFDAVPEGFTAGTDFDLPAGLYTVDAFILLAEPAETRHLSITVKGSPSGNAGVQPLAIEPIGNALGRTIRFSIPIYRASDAVEGFAVNVANRADPDAVDPAVLSVTYADFILLKIN